MPNDDSDARIQTGDASDSLTASTTKQRGTPTSGPWRWYGRKALEGKDATVLVGDCGTASCGRAHLYLSDADALLIAAAPDLLAACKVALNDRMYKDWPGVADCLMAAIAKAEGR